MVSNKQRLEIEARKIRVAKEILSSKKTIEELSASINVPRSTIQRDLNSKELKELIGEESYNKIQTILKENKKVGLSKGGKISVSKNELIRNELGKFEGVKKKIMKSVYIHIPFCNNICSYCDFTKIFYKESFVMPYLDSLKIEINERYNKEKIYSLYIGGGTPSSLSINELLYLFEIISIFDLSELKEFTFECNIDSLDREKLILLKKYGVTRLSIGIQSFNDDNLKLLGISRDKNKTFEMLDFINQTGFYNINLDLIYAIPNQTLESLNDDIDIFLSLNPNHISCYSLMIEPHTKLYIDRVKNIDEDLDFEMYKLIETRLTANGYNHYEISNYSKPNYESKHNLVYWDNLEYYGFGLSASSYINGVRTDNTKSLNTYLEHDFIDNYIDVSKDDMKYALILGFRKIKGINIEEFNKRYDINILNLLHKYIENNKMIVRDNHIRIDDEWIYKMNEILSELV